MFYKIAIALLCLCFLQCHSLTEKLKEVAESAKEKQKEEPSPSPQPSDTTDNSNGDNTGKRRKSVD